MKHRVHDHSTTQLIGLLNLPLNTIISYVHIVFIVIFFSVKDNVRKDTCQYQFVCYKTDLSVKEYMMRLLFTDLFYKRCWKLEYI